MVLCLLALPLFAILGIFSIQYRKLAKDALECLFSTVTFRKCKSSLDDRIKADLTGRVLKLSPKMASFFYAHYKILSWIIMIIFLWSMYTSAVGVYNYANYGNCNGPDDVGFCILDPVESLECGITEVEGSDIDHTDCALIVSPLVEEDDPIIGNSDAELTIIEFGCYTCPYTGKAEPIIQEILEYYEGRVNVQYKTFVLPSHANSWESSLGANCASAQGKYQEYHDEIFSIDELSYLPLEDIAEEIGVDVEEFMNCVDNEEFENEINEDSLTGIHAGVVGTPTFFINEQKIVGPKPFKAFKKIIDEELST